MDEGKDIRGKINLDLLLVEGKDDEHVLYNLFVHYNIPQRFKIKKTEGIDRLIAALDVELDSSELKRIGVVVDADTILEARWNALRNVLVKVGYSSIPVIPDPNGTIIQEEERPTVGIWLMPDDTLPGMIEDFIKFLVPSDDLLCPLAEDAV